MRVDFCERLCYNSPQVSSNNKIKGHNTMGKHNVRPIRTFRTLDEAKSSVKKDGYRYTGHESFKEYKILYYSKGKKNMIITSEPHQYLYTDDMIIGTKWYVFNW